MADNDINNEEQYKDAAKKINDFYNNRKDDLEKICKKYSYDYKKLSLKDVENKSFIDEIYNKFITSFSLEHLKQFKDEDILYKFLFTKGNNEDLCHILEYETKFIGELGIGTPYNKYGLIKNENGWLLGNTASNSTSIDEKKAKDEGKKILDLIVKGGIIIEKYISDNKLENLKNYDELDRELKKETAGLSEKTWIRKYYHMLFPKYFSNWFSDKELTKVLSKLGINNILETYYGKNGQLMNIYKRTGLNNPVLIGSICIVLKDNNYENEFTVEFENGNKEERKQISFPLNQILYGPPGTGKTYNTVIEAMRIINPQLITEYENKRKNYDEVKEEFDKAKKEGRIEFITFHQSYAYEEFVEGIKPDLEDEIDGEIKYKLSDGVFKNIAINALYDRLIFSIEKPQSDFFKFKNIINKFIEKYPIDSEFKTTKSIFKIIKYTEKSIIIKPIDNNYRYSITFKYLEEALNKGYKKREELETINGLSKGLSYYYYRFYQEFLDISKDNNSQDYNKILDNITLEDKIDLIKKYYSGEIKLKDIKEIKNRKLYVLIIDEINRGNISKIFGELITLIEEDKRESFSVRLPYSHEEFTVPKNLYIIGTMNTSDHSIATIDIALRRRFTFKEMMPDSKLVADFGVEFSKKFEELNNRIRILLDRDHQIGHSYFIKDKYENGDIENLKEIWFDCVMPLLNEYFYNDWEKLQALLGKAKLAVDNHKYPSFVKKIEKVDFGDSDYQCDENEQYDFVSDTEIDFEKALENAFTKKTS